MFNRHTPSLTNLRMLGYAVSLTMHVANGLHMFSIFKGDALHDPEVREFYDNQYKYLTVWNVFMQSLYSALGISCEVLSLGSEDKDSPLLQTLKRIRDPMFNCLVFPFSFTVFSVFWPVYLYDSTLMLPPNVATLLTGTPSNHVIHSAILLVVLWEVLFRPRKVPKSHVVNVVVVYMYGLGYVGFITVSYLREGVWAYPVLNVLNGTVYLHLLLGTAVVSAHLFYHMQWYLTDLIWKNHEEIKKVY